MTGSSWRPSNDGWRRLGHARGLRQLDSRNELPGPGFYGASSDECKDRQRKGSGCRCQQEGRQERNFGQKPHLPLVLPLALLSQRGMVLPGKLVAAPDQIDFPLGVTIPRFAFFWRA